MKCTWPMQEFCVGDPTQPIFHWLGLGFCVEVNANFMFGIGGNANFTVFRYQHDGIGNPNSGVGGLSQREDPTQMILCCSGMSALHLIIYTVL